MLGPLSAAQDEGPSLLLYVGPGVVAAAGAVVALWIRRRRRDDDDAK